MGFGCRCRYFWRGLLGRVGKEDEEDRGPGGALMGVALWREEGFYIVALWCEESDVMNEVEVP